MSSLNIKNPMKDIPTLFQLIFSIFLRWSISLGPYSGAGKPPMYGDYEAQRHWQEITVNLDIKNWYKNSSSNNLLYWGLDYPPLTAYHSWLCGIIASIIDTRWIELKTSRGFESQEHKIFMRLTVLVADLLIFHSVVVLFECLTSKSNSNKKMKPLISFSMLILFYPGLILIDYGHFQYNCVSLGFMLLSIYAFQVNSYLFGSFMFCAALNYKQMELYHALPIFFYLLGKIYQSGRIQGFKLFVQVALTVVFSFVVVWLPFLTSVETATQVFSRIFPVDRGLFEDKVATVWCALSPFIKFKEVFSSNFMLILTTLLTLLSCLPSCLYLFYQPTIKNLKFSLLNASLSFFLFSYHVHEKTILIPAISACLLYDTALTLPITLFLHWSVVSMFPLLLRDELVLQTFSSLVLFLSICFSQHGSISSQVDKLFSTFNIKNIKKQQCVVISWLLIISGFVVMLLPLICPFPPVKYPHLFPLINSFVSCILFISFSLIFHYFQFNLNSQVKKYI